MEIAPDGGPSPEATPVFANGRRSTPSYAGALCQPEGYGLRKIVAELEAWRRLFEVG